MDGVVRTGSDNRVMSFTVDSFRRRISEQLPLAQPNRSGIGAGKLNEPRMPSSSVTDLSSLYEIPDSELFLQEAYRLILGRETDVYGFVRFREMLRNYVPREVVIHHLVNSEEARHTQRRFGGMRGFTGATGNLKYGIRQRFQSIAATILLRLRNLVEIVMQGWRFEFLDVKMDSIKQELKAESAQHFHKTEERFWQLSEKLDTYVSDLQSRQAALVEDLNARLNFADGFNMLERHIEAGTRAHSSQLSGAVHRFEELKTDFASYQRKLETRLQKLEAIDKKQQITVEKINTLSQRLDEDSGKSRSDMAKAFQDLDRLIAAEFAEIATRLLPAQRTAITKSVDLLGLQIAAYREEAGARRMMLEGDLTALQESILAQIKDVEGRLQPAVVHGGENVIVTQVDGFIVGVPGEEWRVAAYHVFRGALEPGLICAFREAIQTGMVVVDIGANIGMYTLYAARRTGRTGKVISFEPAPRPFTILKDNVQVNGFLETGIVDFRQVAVSDHGGTGQLTVYPDNSGHSTLFDGSPSGQKIQVVTQRLDDALADQPKIDVIKVDAEGAEPFILRGMQEVLRRNPHVRLFIEFAPQLLQRAGVDPASFLDELAAMSLQIQLVDDSTGELRDISRIDLLHCYSTNLSLSRAPGAQT